MHTTCCICYDAEWQKKGYWIIGQLDWHTLHRLPMSVASICHVHIELEKHAACSVSPIVKIADSSTYFSPVLNQPWTLPSVHLMPLLWLVALPAWPQDIVHKVFQDFCLLVWELWRHSFCQAVNDSSSFILQDRHIVILWPGNRHKIIATARHNVHFAVTVSTRRNRFYGVAGLRCTYLMTATATCTGSESTKLLEVVYSMPAALVKPDAQTLNNQLKDACQVEPHHWLNVWVCTDPSH